jgi:hypothetical protein
MTMNTSDEVTDANLVPHWLQRGPFYEGSAANNSST